MSMAIKLTPRTHVTDRTYGSAGAAEAARAAAAIANPR